MTRVRVVVAFVALCVIAASAIGANAPVITSLSPATAIAGTGSMTLVVKGVNFAAAARVRVNNSPRDTTFVSATELRATLTASDIATARTLSIVVFSGNELSAPVNFNVLPNEPAITTLDPNTVSAGGAAFTLRVTGQNFASTAKVRLNGSDRETTYINDKNLDAKITAADIAGARTVNITVLNPSSRLSNAVPLTVVKGPLTPTITLLSPNRVTAGDPAFILSITGTNFDERAVVKFNDTQRTPTIIDSSHMTVQVLTSIIAQPGTINVTVVNPNNLVSAPAQLIVDSETTPIVNAVTPQTFVQNARDLAITIDGSNFQVGAQVRVGTSPRSTTVVSSTRITSSLLAIDVDQPGELQITVKNPGTTGAVSDPKTITIVSANAPTINSVSPASIEVDSSILAIVVNGTGYKDTDKVLVNGAERTTTFVSASQLAATLQPGDVAAAGELSITVRNNRNEVSAPFKIRVVDAATPVIDSLSPTTAEVGGAGFTLTIRGANFVSDSVVSVNGVARDKTYVSTTELRVNILASDLTDAGSVPIVVTNPSGAASEAVNLTVQLTPPVITSIDPVSVAAGESGLTLNVSGTNFSSSAVISIDNKPLTTRFISSTNSLSAILSAGDISVPRTVNVTVTDRGVTSEAFAFSILRPAITSLSQTLVSAGSGDLTITVNGTSFLPTSKVNFKGGERDTTYVSETQLTALIPASALGEVGEFAVTVSNGPSAISLPAILSIVSPGDAAIESLTPTSITVGAESLELHVRGVNFLPDAQILVNGEPRTTVYAGSTELITTLTAADLDAPGTLQITVRNSTTGNPTAAATFAIVDAPVTGPRRRSVRH